MKIQRFKGKTAQEALEQARMALGPDALILQTRRVQSPGIQGLISRPQVEVLAAIDTPASRSASRPQGGTSEGERDTLGSRGVSPGLARPPAPGSGAVLRGPVPARPAEAWDPPPEPNGDEWKSELTALRREVASLRSLLSSAGRSGSGWPHPGDAPPDEWSRTPTCGSPPWRGAAPEGSSGAEFPSTGTSLSERGPVSMEALAQRLMTGLVTRPIEIRDGECTVVALVGPTGVGKTTTIAKLAAVASRIERKRVAFISADTYRIGAIEQLQTYAHLLEIPMSVAYSREDVKAARERYVNYDLVLMDTVGRSPSNYPQLEELAGLLEVARPNEVHLALDARGSYATQDCVLRGFRTLRPTHLLLSKVDETPRLEDSLVAALDGGLPLSYVTTGQRVPEDLLAADGAQLAAWLLGGR